VLDGGGWILFIVVCKNKQINIAAIRQEYQYIVSENDKFRSDLDLSSHSLLFFESVLSNYIEDMFRKRGKIPLFRHLCCMEIDSEKFNVA
jgi:hypothetical protein